VPVFPPHGVFVNYRREDTGPYACLLQFKLRERFPNMPVFMDLDSIEAGVDFAEAIKSGVEACAVLVALIGAKWLTITDEDGRRRLDDPDDYVRYEIRTALERCVRVIPVLVDEAKAPRHQQLPEDLQRLARLNALEMSYARLDYDATRLTDAIQRVLEAKGGNLEEWVAVGSQADGNGRHPDGAKHSEIPNY
jgi:TIR domain